MKVFINKPEEKTILIEMSYRELDILGFYIEKMSKVTSHPEDILISESLAAINDRIKNQNEN